jgi:hypothetical protein
MSPRRKTSKIGNVSRNVKVGKTKKNTIVAYLLKAEAHC